MYTCAYSYVQKCSCYLLLTEELYVLENEYKECIKIALFHKAIKLRRRLKVKCTSTAFPFYDSFSRGSSLANYMQECCLLKGT